MTNLETRAQVKATLALRKAHNNRPYAKGRFDTVEEFQAFVAEKDQEGWTRKRIATEAGVSFVTVEKTLRRAVLEERNRGKGPIFPNATNRPGATHTITAVHSIRPYEVDVDGERVRIVALLACRLDALGKDRNLVGVQLVSRENDWGGRWTYWPQAARSLQIDTSNPTTTKE